MTVVSDTSPINDLVLIELQDLLPALFEERFRGVSGEGEGGVRQLKLLGTPDSLNPAFPVMNVTR
jgi:hypothetical protein